MPRASHKPVGTYASTESFESLCRLWMGRLVLDGEVFSFAVRMAHVGAGAYLLVTTTDKEVIVAHTHMPCSIRESGCADAPLGTPVLLAGAEAQPGVRRAVTVLRSDLLVSVVEAPTDTDWLPLAVDAGWAPILPMAGARFVLGEAVLEGWLADDDERALAEPARAWSALAGLGGVGVVGLALDGVLCFSATGELELAGALVYTGSGESVARVRATFSFVGGSFAGEFVARDGRVGRVELSAASESDWATLVGQTASPFADEAAVARAPMRTTVVPSKLPDIRSRVDFPDVPKPRSRANFRARVRRKLACVAKCPANPRRRRHARNSRACPRAGEVTPVTAPHASYKPALHEIPHALLPRGAVSAVRLAIFDKVCEHWICGYCRFGTACRKVHKEIHMTA